MIRGWDFGGFGVQRRAKVPGIGGKFTTASIFGNRQRDIRETCPSGTERQRTGTRRGLRQGRRRARDPAVPARRYAGRPMLAAGAALVSGLPLMHRTSYIRLARTLCCKKARPDIARIQTMTGLALAE